MVLKILAVFAALCFTQAQARVTRDPTPTQTSGEVEKLFYGFNVTAGKSITEQDALQTRKPIIDLNSDYKDHITKYTGSTETRSSSYASSSLTDVSKQYSMGLGAGAMGKIYMVDFNIDATFDLSTKLNQVYSQYFEIYSTYIKRHYYLVNLSTSEIRERLDPEFVAELNAIKNVSDAKAVIANYGTHLNTGYTFGGRLDISCYKTTSSQSFALEQSASLSSQIGVAVGAVNAGTSFNISENIAQEYKTSQSDIKYSFTSYGGDSVSALTIDGLFVFTQSLVDAGKSGFVYTNWVNSINEDRNLAIVDIPSNGAQSIPLWNLLGPSAENSQKRAYLQEAYMELAGDKYEEYQNKYKELTRSVSGSQESTDGTSTINSVYIKTPNNYFIDVDGNDFVDRDKFTEVHKDEILYFDLERYTPIEKISFDSVNSRGVELVDLNAGVFKVTGNPGQIVDIKVKYGSKTVSLFDPITIKSSNFEGGIGTERYPYLISDAAQFEYLAGDNVDKYYMLVKDIDFGNQQIESIGDFEGYLDGNYCKLSNFVVKPAGSSEYYGLIEKNSGSVKNLVIENAGTSTSLDNFNEGGDVATEEKFTKNSISVKRAGVLAAYNTGKIENVQLINPIIRNINKRYVDFAYVGALIGENKGTIKNSAVRDHVLLNSVVFENDDTENAFSIATGALIGALSGGEVSGVVADSNNIGTVISQMHDQAASTVTKIDLVASGFIGLVTSNTPIKNSYAYNRGNKTISVKANAKFKRGDSHIVRTASFVMNAENLDKSCTKVYIANKEENRLTLPCYYDSQGIVADVNANVIETKNEGVTSIEVTSGGQYSKIGLSSLFEFDSSSSSGIKSKLCFAKNTYITTQWASNNKVRSSFYDGEYFSPAGVKVSRNVAEGDSETVGILYIPDYPTELAITNSYSYKVYLDGDKQIEISRVSLEIDNNELSSIFVDDSEQYETYHDLVEDYIDNFSYDSIKLKGVLTNGNIVDITADGQYLNRAKLELKTTTIENGENEIFISYGTASKKFSCSYLLRCIRRHADSIRVTKNPTKVEYAAYEKFDPSGMEVTIGFDYGEDKVITGTKLTKEIEFTGDMLSFGKNEVILTYEDYRVTTKYIVNIDDRITITVSGNYQTEFTVGDTFTYEGLYLLKTSESGASETITSGFTVVTPNMSTPGEKTVTVVYNGENYTYTIVVSPAQTTITSIAVAVSPRTSFYVGDTFTSEGLVVTVNYSDGTSVNVSGSQCQVSTPNMATPGEKTVTVTYQGKSTTYTITVISNSGDKTVTGIRIATYPKTEFNVGDTFTYDGLTISVNYSDGTKESVDGSFCQVSTPNMSTAGTKEVTVSYRGFTDKYTITVKEVVKVVSRIAIKTEPRTYYFVGDTFNKAGLTIDVYYTDGTSEVVDGSKCEVSSPNMYLKGTQKVTVTYQGKTAEFEITIVEKSSGGGSGGGSSSSGSKPCGGSIAATSAILSTTALLGLVLIVIKKKNEKNK